MTPQARIPATPGARLSTRGRRGDHRSGDRPAAIGLKPLSRLGAACAAAGVLMIVGGVAGHSQIAAPNGVALMVHSQPAAGPPVTPGPGHPPKAQQPHKPQKPQPGPPGGGGHGFYAHCREAVTPGPPPNQRAKPGQYSPFDRDQDGKSCED